MAPFIPNVHTHAHVHTHTQLLEEVRDTYLVRKLTKSPLVLTRTAPHGQST